ncbi:MAG: hypothetical protein Q9162_005092 [Coniocarpon cinnabarinum]
MAPSRSRRTPIAIFEDGRREVSQGYEDASSDEEDRHSAQALKRTNSYESDEASEHRDHYFVDDEDFIVSTNDDETDSLDTSLSPSSLGHVDPFNDVRPQSHSLRLPPQDRPLKSIENKHASHKASESFSTTSRAYIDDRVDPHLGYVAPEPGSTRDENDRRPALEGALVKYGYDSRKVSESVSTLPDELDYYRSSLPGRSPKLAYDPRSIYNTPNRSLPYGPHHSRSNSGIRHESRPHYRSPSDIRAMQLGSPPPLRGSPMSAKQKRSTPMRVKRSDSPFVTHSRDGTRTRRMRANLESVEAAKPNQEFPLVLLHCTLHLMNEPAGHSPEALEGAGASDRVKNDAALLRRKLDPTIVERGVLIQHPGEDLELLEDRVLESLELRKPRIGACGHFRRSSDVASAQPDNHSKAEGEEVKAGCPSCTGHLAHNLLNEEEQEKHRRWEIRIYAANGLMRAGAWSAAWREMERVDVEVGVWLGPDDAELGVRLDEWVRKKELEEAEAERRVHEQESPRSVYDMRSEAMSTEIEEPRSPDGPVDQEACAVVRTPSLPSRISSSQRAATIITPSAENSNDTQQVEVAEDIPVQATTTSAPLQVNEVRPELHVSIQQPVDDHSPSLEMFAPPATPMKARQSSSDLHVLSPLASCPTDESADPILPSETPKPTSQCRRPSVPDFLNDTPTTRQLPLSTLLHNYFRCQLQKHQHLFLPLLILALAAYISVFDVFGTKTKDIAPVQLAVTTAPASEIAPSHEVPLMLASPEAQLPATVTQLSASLPATAIAVTPGAPIAPDAKDESQALAPASIATAEDKPLSSTEHAAAVEEIPVTDTSPDEEAHVQELSKSEEFDDQVNGEEKLNMPEKQERAASQLGDERVFAEDDHADIATSETTGNDVAEPREDETSHESEASSLFGLGVCSKLIEGALDGAKEST